MYQERFKASGDETRFRILRLFAHYDDALCVCELVDILRKPQYAISRALTTLRRCGLLTEQRKGKLMFYAVAREPFNDHLVSSFKLLPRDEAAEHDLDRLRWRLEIRDHGNCLITYRAEQTRAGTTKQSRALNKQEKQKILFICVHNSARSQMAEAYLKHYAVDLFHAESAGLEPGTLNPYVVEVMREAGMDIAGKETRAVNTLYRSGKTYAYVVTVCSPEAEKKCPLFPDPVRRLSWPFPDPSQFRGSRQEILAKTREIRDAIAERIRGFVEDYRGE